MERVAHDCNIVKNMMVVCSLGSESNKIHKVIRLRKSTKDGSKPRTVMAKFLGRVVEDNTLENIRVLQCNKLCKNVRIKNDLTTREMQREAVIWTEAKNLNAAGKGRHSHSAILEKNYKSEGAQHPSINRSQQRSRHSISHATGAWERLVSSGIKPQPRSQFCSFVAPSHHLKGPRFHTPSSHAGSSSAASSSSGYSSSHSHDSYRTRRIHPDDSLSPGGMARGSSGGTRLSNVATKCSCHDCVEEEEEEDIDPSRLRSLIQKNCTNASTTQLKLSISKFSQLNLSHLGRYYSYSMLSNDSTESIVEESLASTCDSLGSKIVKSQSIHLMGKDKEGRSEGMLAGGMTRDIVSVPNFGDLKDGDGNSGPASQMPVNQVKVITVLPAEGPAEANLEDDPSDLVAGIKGRLAFTHEDTLRSTDTSISENLMSFSCTTDSNLSSNTNLYGSSSYNTNTSGLSSFANPNYVGFDPGREGGGLLSQDYWQTGALDLESLRHKEFAEMLRTPPDSGIGLGVEMERRTPLDLKIATLEDFVTFDNQTACFSKAHTDEHQPEGTNRAAGKTPAPSTARVTFSSQSKNNSSEERPEGGGASREASEGGRGDPPPPRINPFMREEPALEPHSPSAMYIVGGKEMDQMTAFKRPISVWKLDLPF